MHSNFLLVSLCNKAWILVTDIWSFFDSKHELNIEMTTVRFSTIFVDYRVPQILNHFNALVYSKSFLNKLEKKGKTYYFLSIFSTKFHFLNIVLNT